MPNNESFMNLVNALSLVIGMQNLQENREQSAHNDIHFENELQAQYLLTEIVAAILKKKYTESGDIV